MNIEWRNLGTYLRAFVSEHKKTALVLIGLTLLLLGKCVFAQSIDFTVTPTASVGEATPVAKVDVTSANPGTTCTASGGWSGAKTLGSTTTLPKITANTTYTIACSSPAVAADTQATLSWLPPSLNTDGSTLTDLSAYRIFFGTAADQLSQTQDVTNPAATSDVVKNLTSGTQYFFGLRALTSHGQQSALSNIVSKTPAKGIPAWSATKSVTVTITPATIPNPPTGLQVVSQTAYSVEMQLNKRRLAFILDRPIGTVPLGTSCKKDFHVEGTPYYRVDASKVTFTRAKDRTFLVVAACSDRLANVEAG